MKEYIESHLVESKKSAIKTSLAIQHSDLEYKDPYEQGKGAIYTRTLQIPKVFTQQDKKNFQAICKMFYSIFEKTVQAYKKDPAVRELFHFSPLLNELIALESGYQALIPMLRVDIFYNEETGDFKVCEFNTDGTSAMFENNKMVDLLSYNSAWQNVKPDVEYMELMETWADAFLKDAKEATGLDKPAIVITDFLEQAYLPELYAFEQVFRKRGLLAEVVDIRDLRYDNGKLRHGHDGPAFDVVYRRAVTNDVLERADTITPFLEAVRNKAVTLIGAFQTQIPHSKMISEALFQPPLRRYFTEEECSFIDAHLPESFDLEEQSAEKVLKNKDHWIIKPKEGYGAKGVWAGVDVSQKHWEKLVQDSMGKGYITQEYISHYKTPNIDLLKDTEFKPYSNMTGLYVYNGEFAGVYSRLSDMGIISTQYNERMVPTLFLKDA